MGLSIIGPTPHQMLIIDSCIHVLVLYNAITFAKLILLIFLDKLNVGLLSNVSRIIINWKTLFKYMKEFINAWKMLKH